MRIAPLLLFALLTGCVTRPATESTSTYLQSTHRDGQLFIGAQPTLLDLEALARTGTRSVLNLRSAEEMKTVAYDEGAAAEQLGLSYMHLPVSGSDQPYSPQHLEAFAAAMEREEGQVLLHCASGGRAAQVYAAWLVKYRAHTPQQALEKLKNLGGWPMPMERLLGQPLKVEFLHPDMTVASEANPR